MFDRAQSDAIGVILLTGILTVTITGAGGVVLTEWQSDIGPTPLADIDSEITPVEMTLEHLGGDPLAPNETTVVLVGSDAKVSLEERFEPGETESWAFDRLDGPVELRIVDDQSGETIYRRSHAVENPVENLILAVDGWTEPVYLLEDHPANYSVEQEFEQGVPADVTGRANITVDDDSQLTVDEAETTMEGTDGGFETTATVEVDNRTAETDVQVLDTPQQLQVRTRNVSAVSLTSLAVTGELTELDDLPSANLSVSFAPFRPFNGEPSDSGDGIVSDGPFIGTNYTHSNDGWIHDNEPIEPGTTRTYIYEYKSEVDTDDSFWALRGSKQTTPNKQIFDIEREVLTEIPFEEPGTYRIEVTRSEDGQTADVVVYTGATGRSELSSQSDIDISSVSDLYVSTHYDRYDNENDLRLTNVFDSSDTTRVVHDPAADSEGRFSEEISGLAADRNYTVVTYAERDHNGARSVDFGSRSRVGTEGPTVDTVAADGTRIDSINVTGELVDLGTATQANLSVGYAPLRPFNGEPSNSGDGIVSDGPFVGTNYTHSNDGWIHDNEPIEPGTTHTYIYEYKSGVDTDDSFWALRGSKQTTPNKQIFDIEREVLEEIPFEDPGTYRIAVTRSEDGQTADVVVYTGATGRSVLSSQSDIDISSVSELYVSTHYDRADNENDLWLTGVFENSDTSRIVRDPAADSEERFFEEISGLAANRNYTVVTYAERDHNGARSVDFGSRSRVGTEGPTVDTVAAEATGTDSINVTGELVDLGTATQANLSVEYTPLRSFNGKPGDNGDNIISEGPFVDSNYTVDSGIIHDNKPIEPGTTRTYTYELNPGSIHWTFRDSKRTTRDGRRGDYEYYKSDRLSLDGSGIYRIEVTLGEDGQTADVVVYDAWIGGSVVHSNTNVTVATDSGLYFSTSHRFAATDRLTGVFNTHETTQVVYDPAAESERTFSKEITGLDANRSYTVNTYAQRQRNGQIVTDTGSLIWVDMESP